MPQSEASRKVAQYRHHRDVQRVAGFLRIQIEELERRFSLEVVTDALMGVLIRRLEDRTGREDTLVWLTEISRQLAAEPPTSK